MSQRDVVEDVLLKEFPKKIKPIELDDLEIINRFKDGSFGFSYLGLLLYANGYNLRGISKKYLKGLLYYDGENIFGIGYFKKDINEENGHLHIIAPRGKDWLPAVDKFIKDIRSISEIPNNSIYIRHLDRNQYNKLIELGYDDISKSPWSDIAPREDETYNSRLIDLDDVIEYDDKGLLKIKILKGNESKNFRKKTRSAYLRFGNFLERNNSEVIIEQHNLQNLKDAENILKKFFNILNEKSDGAVLSTFEDYLNIIKSISPKDEIGKTFFQYVGYLKGVDYSLPVMYFAGERIDLDTVALYATFALRDRKMLPTNVDSKGYTAISQYCYMKIFDILYKKGIRKVDLGGSEVVDLDLFKKQLGAIVKETYWVIKL